MTFLADANLLSEGMKPQPNRRVWQWLTDHGDDIVIDPIVLGEIQFGILLLPKGKKRQALEHWFEKGVRRIVCLPWEAATALQWATLLAKLRRAGRSMPIKDSMIAATALAHGLTVATRNSHDFAQAGVPVVNPFD